MAKANWQAEDLEHALEQCANAYPGEPVHMVAPDGSKALKARLAIYDDGGKTFDRYTAVYLDEPERLPGTYECVGMSEHPFHPQGFGQHSGAMPGRHLGKRITFDKLPVDCRRLVLRDLNC
jgi:hypothetical protein